MLDIKYLNEHPDEVIKKLAGRGMDLDLESYRGLSRNRKELLGELEKLRYQLNSSSKKIGLMKRDGKDASALIVEMKGVSDKIKKLEEDLRCAEEELRNCLLQIPNLPHDSVPMGRDSRDNREIRRVGDIPEFSFSPRPHWEIGKNLGILDFETAAKITGARFAVYMGAGARLERALINFMLDIHTREKGYLEVLPPFIVNAESLTGTGNLPKFEEDLFKLRGKNWYMIPTAEVPLTNTCRGEILDASELPRRLVAHTPCFRSEAGSYGKDIRGLIRQHQFNKVELVSFAHPEHSLEELERLTGDAEDILKRLGMPYRVIALCTGDLGFAGAKTYDLEIWMPQRNDFVEISSCTNCWDFQARRANIRFKREVGAKPEYVHTLNGSGLAVGRTVSALLEVFQQEDGSVLIPDALRPYMDGRERITCGSM